MSGWHCSSLACCCRCRCSLLAVGGAACCARRCGCAAPRCHARSSLDVQQGSCCLHCRLRHVVSLLLLLLPLPPLPPPASQPQLTCLAAPSPHIAVLPRS